MYLGRLSAFAWVPSDETTSLQRHPLIASVSFKATFHLMISMRRQRATGKIEGIITITGVAGLL